MFDVTERSCRSWNGVWVEHPYALRPQGGGKRDRTVRRTVLEGGVDGVGTLRTEIA